MACIHAYAAEPKKLYSRIGLSFALIYAVVILVDYFLQFTVVLPLAGGRAERAIRGLFVLSFVLAVVAFVGLAVLRHDLVAFEVTVLMITWIVLIASGVLLSVVFRRAGQSQVGDLIMRGRFSTRSSRRARPVGP